MNRFYDNNESGRFIYLYELNDNPTPAQFAHYRKRKRLYQKDLAEIVHKSQRQISRYETGETPIPYLVIEALRNAEEGIREL